MRVLIINGSPRPNSNSSLLINEMVNVFNHFDVKSDVISLVGKDVRGCSACLYCKSHDGCVYNDIVNEANELFKEADGLIIVSPVYYASPNGTLISFLDRLFYSSRFDKRMKVGAGFAIARRGGTESSFDVLNKYFTISGMPIVSGDYWNNAFGALKGEVVQDKEGMRNARIVAKRMVFLIKSIKDGKEKYSELLIDEERVGTNFIK